jgi:hypothetical protein
MGNILMIDFVGLSKTIIKILDSIIIDIFEK